MRRVGRAAPGGPPVEARSFDISIAGVGLVSPRALPVGQGVALTFQIRDRSGREAAEAIPRKVVHTRADEQGPSHGAQFRVRPDPRSTPVLPEKRFGA